MVRIHKCRRCSFPTVNRSGLYGLICRISVGCRLGHGVLGACRNIPDRQAFPMLQHDRISGMKHPVVICRISVCQLVSVFIGQPNGKVEYPLRIDCRLRSVCVFQCCLYFLSDRQIYKLRDRSRSHVGQMVIDKGGIFHQLRCIRIDLCTEG